VSVARGGNNLEDAVVNGEERDVEGAAAEVEDEDVLLARLLVEAVGDGGGGGLVDDTHDVEARDGARVLGGLALGVVEVGGDGDDSVLHLLAEVDLGRLLHLDQDHGGDLLRREDLGVARGDHLDVGLALGADDLEGPQLHVVLDGRVRKPPADQALRVVHGVARVEGSLVLGGVADEALAIREGDVRGRHAVTLVVGNDLHLAVLVDADARVRRAEVDADDITDLRTTSSGTRVGNGAVARGGGAAEAAGAGAGGGSRLVRTFSSFLSSPRARPSVRASKKRCMTWTRILLLRWRVQQPRHVAHHKNVSSGCVFNVVCNGDYFTHPKWQRFRRTATYGGNRRTALTVTHSAV
jgi:hypothetical protein